MATPLASGPNSMAALTPLRVRAADSGKFISRAARALELDEPEGYDGTEPRHVGIAVDISAATTRAFVVFSADKR
jgi:hypothetical protein